jgi:hypothetical protein
MSDKAQAMIDELVAACIEFGRQADPDRLTRLKKARQELHEYIAELEAKVDQLTAHSDIERQDDKWIPVSERLPEDLQSIIVFTKDRKTYIIRFLELYGREGFGSLSDIVTHWMPLPVLPESPNDTQSSTIVYGKEGEE